MRFKSFVRSLAALTFALLFLMGALARPVLAQSDDAASSPDSKEPTLQVSPGALSFGAVVVGHTSTPQTETASDPSAKKKIKITNVSVSAGFTITTDNCSGKTIKGSNTCAVDVACMPTSVGVITGGLITFNFKTNKKHQVTETLACTGATAATATATQTATAISAADPADSISRIMALWASRPTRVRAG